MQQSEILVILKIIVMASFFLIVTFFGTLPLRSKSFKRRPLLKAIGGTFAGCLFLNVAIMHILPEAADTLEQYLRGDEDQHDHDKEVFPLAYALLMVGFIITVFFTKVLSFHSHEEDHAEEENADEEVSEDTDTSPRKKRRPEEWVNPNQSESGLKISLITQQQAGDSVPPKTSPRKIKKSATVPTQGISTQQQPQTVKVKHYHSHDSNDNHDHDHHHDHDHDHHVHNHGEPSLQSHHPHVLENKSMLNEAFILTIAIYFHTIFEGIAIGVQNNITGFLSTAIAIAFHKWADALSMGCHYRTKNVQKNLSYSLIFIQALLNVLSIGLGWLISSSGDVVQAIFLSISAGTFLAISTIEMLGQQLHHRQYMVIKFLLLVGASCFVASIWFLENSIFNQEDQ